MTQQQGTGQGAPVGDWRHRAACRDEDPELFFPKGTIDPIYVAQAEDAKEVCRRCPVRIACLEWALATNQDFGVWGGMWEEERRAYRRRRMETAARQRRREQQAAERTAQRGATKAA